MHVNQQITHTELTIYTLLQKPDDALGDAIDAQQNKFLRQQQVLADQRIQMDRNPATQIFLP